MALIRLADMRAAGPHVHRVQRLAGDHEQAIAARAPEADVGADLRQLDQADALPRRRKDLDAVVTRSAAPRADPDVAVYIGANAIGQTTCFARHFHIGELFFVADTLAVDHFEYLNVPRVPGVADVHLLVIGRKTDAVGLVQLIGELFHFGGFLLSAIYGFFKILLVLKDFLVAA